MPVLTAFENVELPLLLTDLSRRERRERVDIALRWSASPIARITIRTSSRAGSSSAWRSRARSSRDPTLIVADEPTGDLDATPPRKSSACCERLNRELGKTILMVTHDPKAAENARRVIHLEKGVLAN